jgi:hypothetical protein
MPTLLHFKSCDVKSFFEARSLTSILFLGTVVQQTSPRSTASASRSMSPARNIPECVGGARLSEDADRDEIRRNCRAATRTAPGPTSPQAAPAPDPPHRRWAGPEPPTASLRGPNGGPNVRLASTAADPSPDAPPPRSPAPMSIRPSALPSREAAGSGAAPPWPPRAANQAGLTGYLNQPPPPPISSPAAEAPPAWQPLPSPPAPGTQAASVSLSHPAGHGGGRDMGRDDYGPGRDGGPGCDRSAGDDDPFHADWPHW